MDRPRRIVLFVVFFVTLLVPCTDMCLETGQMQRTMLASSAAPQGREPGPCHSSHAAPQETPTTCPGYGSHVFLRPLPPGTATGVASGPALPLLCPCGPALDSARREHNVIIAAPVGTTPRPRFLTLVVLRL